jgi:YegS/Rv2252/BmrU family lipid kinase
MAGPAVSLIKTLERRQKQHRALVEKLQKTTARLERRKLKLQELESRIADLERKVAGPRKRGRKGDKDGSLRPAQLIFNPASGRDEEDNAARLAQVVSSLRAHGIHAQIGLKTSGKVARSLARDAARAGCPLVIVAAGDGTIDDIASQLMGSSTVMGIIPIGTMNNVARSLGIPLEIDEACALIGMGTTRSIDLGRVRSNAKPNEEYFVECAGVGLSAIAALAGQQFEKHRWRNLPRSLRRFFETKPGSMQIEMDGVTIEASTRIVTVSNSPLMGNNMLAAPGAKMDDGFLDVSIYEGMGDTALVKHFMAASSGTPDELKIYRARHIRITAEEAVMSNSGMNIAPERHVVEIEVVPSALSMIVGNGIALSMPVEAAPAAPTFADAPPATNGHPADAAVEATAAGT